VKQAYQALAAAKLAATGPLASDVTQTPTTKKESYTGKIALKGSLDAKVVVAL
jgi:hypothetical protein